MRVLHSKESICLNILALLKKGNATFKELLESGVFRNPNDLKDGIDILEEGGCIERIETERTIVYVVQENGLRLLEAHPNWKLDFDMNFLARMDAVK